MSSTFKEMKNPFIKASVKVKHLKIVIYGGPGTGKTYFALGFPNPAVIDLEGGTDLYADRFQFSVLDTKSFAEILDAVNFLETGQHDFKTLVIDPITVIWSALQEGRLEHKTNDNINKVLSGEKNFNFTYVDWGQLKRFYSMLMTKLVNLPMHIVLVGRQKDEYDIRGNDKVGIEMIKIGVKMESEKSTPYIPDIFFRLEVGKDGKRVAIFEKDRSGHFQVGTRIENISYETFRPLIESTKGTEQVVHQSEEDAGKKDAAFFQAHERPSPKTNGNGNGASPSFDELISLFKVLELRCDESSYSNYLISKYGVEELSHLTWQIFNEQKKILLNMSDKPEIKEQFQAKLLELSRA